MRGFRFLGVCLLAVAGPASTGCGGESAEGPMAPVGAPAQGAPAAPGNGPQTPNPAPAAAAAPPGTSPQGLPVAAPTLGGAAAPTPVGAAGSGAVVSETPPVPIVPGPVEWSSFNYDLANSR